MNNWRKDVSGGVAAAFAGLPLELVYGLLAVAPLGAAYADHGLRAALWGCVLAGFSAVLLRSTGGMITGSRPATGLILATLAGVLLGQTDIQAMADPAAAVFLLLLACTALAGVIQAAAGLAGIGKALKYVPYPVIAGLTCGVGILMAKSAARPLLGLSAGGSWSDWQPLTLFVGAATCALCFRAPRLTRRVPGVVLAMLAGSLLHHLLAALFGSAHLGGTAGATHGLLPHFSLAQAAADGGAGWLLPWLPRLFPYAAAIAAFASLEGMLCLSAIEASRHCRCDGNREMTRQGLANVIGGLFGATPSVANLSRVMVNLSAGATGTTSAAAYATTLALIVLFAGPYAHYVPDAVTAGILLFYAQAMVDEGVRRMGRQLLLQRSDMSPRQYRRLAANFTVIVVVALVATFGQMMQALGVGVAAAMFLFVKASMKPVIRQVSDASQRRSLKVRAPTVLDALASEGQRIAIIEIDGPLFFGTADRAAEAIERTIRQASWIILDLARVKDIDATGARSLLRIGEQLAQQEKRLLLSGMSKELGAFLKLMGMRLPLHQENWFQDLDTALEVAEDELLAHLDSHLDAASVDLAETAFAAGLSTIETGLLAGYLQPRTCTGGTRLFRAGDEGSSLFLARDSIVDIQIPLADACYKRVASFAPGNVFGEMALLEQKPRSADAMVLNDSLVWELTHEQFLRIRREHPEIASQLMFNLSRLIAHRLRNTTSELMLALRAA